MNASVSCLVTAFRAVPVVLVALVSTGVPARAGEDSTPVTNPQVEELARRVEDLERTVAEQKETIRKLGPSPAGVSAGSAADTVSANPQLEEQLARELGAAPTPVPAPSPVPIVAAPSGRSYVNISLDALLAGGTSMEPDLTFLEPGGHDPAQRGFTVQNVEAVLDGAVDPYFKGQANIVLQINPVGETTVELEEVYATTTSLPHNLQAKVGSFFTEFGRLNAQHPHSWDFVDQPLVNARLFGGDGLRGPGARASWLIPAPFYSELFLSAQNAHGETQTSFGSVPGEIVFGRPIEEQRIDAVNDLLFAPRYAASFDLTDEQTLLFGGSMALGPNGTGEGGRTRIYGLDVFWKWKPTHADQGFPFLKIQAEGMRRRYAAAAIDTLGAATFRDWGAYTQVVWGFRRRWTLGVRYDEVGGDRGDVAEDPALEARQRTSANVTWFPSEYSKLRLQYNNDAREFSNDANSFWLQLEFLLGAHAAHKF